MRLAHAHDVILSDVRAAQKILALHVEDVDNVQELIRISLDEVREEIATNYTDLAIEVHAVQALLHRFLNSLLVNGGTLKEKVRAAAQHDIPICAAVFSQDILHAATQPNKRARAEDDPGAAADVKADAAAAAEADSTDDDDTSSSSAYSPIGSPQSSSNARVHEM